MTRDFPKQDARSAPVSRLSRDNLTGCAVHRAFDRAFTLIELLVVVAVIAILAALLLSALSGTKLQAQQAKCIGNLKQLALAQHMYADDFAGGIQNAAGMGYINPWETLLRPYCGGSQALMLCPAAFEVATFGSSINGEMDDFGSADAAWHMEGSVVSSPTAVTWYSVSNYGSYAFNAWLYNPWGNPGGNGAYYFRKPSAVQQPVRTPVFADSITHDVLPNPEDLPATNLYSGDGDDGASMASITIARHGSRPASAAPTDVDIARRLPGLIDVAFFDGHVEKSPLDNLWNYSWYAKWRIPTPRPGLER
jgi:prepilin-type N-terminal cleavage/methylation domain-containing protein/prepilin-type processing-associated H-X9-DG protein